MDDNKPSSSSGGAGGGENEAHTEYIYSLQQQHARGGSYVTREEALQSFPDLKQFQKMEENLETCWKKAVDFWKSQDTETDTSFTQSIEALAEQWGKSSKSLKKAMRDLVLLLRTAATQNVSPQMLKQDLINLRTSAVVEPVAVVGLGLALGLIQVPERR
eukprot:gb/GECG01001861.1/.p1 GENE.gb/GECG01001861.1/~~gb/GECG01001861.1/.p1  ORF type:complete len:160 (+),score=28.47 gb/GECG01001861.1/:1-480(+)